MTKFEFSADRDFFLMAAYKSTDNPSDGFPRSMQMSPGDLFIQPFIQYTCKIYLIV